MDDLTIESLADRLYVNRRGILVAKDEMSHWFESFDLYRNTGGADVSRWCSLHTGVEFLLDRRTDDRHQRIWLPRVCITGGIQPKVFQRKMTEDFFDRGLLARLLFAFPPERQRRWRDAIVEDDLRAKVRDLFKSLLELEPGRDDHGQIAPKLLRLSDEAKEIFIPFFDESGGMIFQTGERETAAWNKLIMNAAALALLGQLLRDPDAEEISGEIMRAACELARWFGNEATRIYATLVETQWQRDQRRLVEFVISRGGKVSINETMQSFYPLKNQRDEIQRHFDALAKAELGKYLEQRTGTRGPKTLLFQLNAAPESTSLTDSREKTEKEIDRWD
jgi:hypothetical protein